MPPNFIHGLIGFVNQGRGLQGRSRRQEAEVVAPAGRAGMSVSVLGPVRPNLDPGKPFPPLAEAKIHAVNSPVEVTVNGKACPVVNALGWPGMNNVYRVDFRVPEGTTAGTATLGLSRAWINGPEVKIPVR